MFWKLAIPAILAWTLFVSTETKKPRPQGSIPSPYKLKGNDLSSPSHTPASLPQHTSAQRQKGKHDMLTSSREALVVTERKYLKSDWCKTQPLRQTVSLEGCLSRTVINRFCYGQCNSFYIPRHLTSQASRRSRKTASTPDHHTSFQSCAFCRPSRITTVTVRLHCPGLQPPYRQRKVQRIKQCKCVSVNVNAAYWEGAHTKQCFRVFFFGKTGAAPTINVWNVPKTTANQKTGHLHYVWTVPHYALRECLIAAEQHSNGNNAGFLFFFDKYKEPEISTTYKTETVNNILVLN